MPKLATAPYRRLYRRTKRVNGITMLVSRINMEKKVGLYFGSFNPVHIGHLIVANTVLDKTDLDEVWFVISPMSPDKVNMNLVHHDERYKILKEALTDNNQLHVSTIEFDMEQPNYTYKTLEKLRKKL